MVIGMVVFGQSRLLSRGVFYDCLQKALGDDVTEESFDELLGRVCMLGVGFHTPKFWPTCPMPFPTFRRLVAHVGRDLGHSRDVGNGVGPQPSKG